MSLTGGVMPAATGSLGAVKTYDAGALRRAYIQDDVRGHFKPSRERFLLHNQKEQAPLQQRMLAWLRDHVHKGIPRAYYDLVLGHDCHISLYATLHVRHFHATQRDPFTGKMGWLENVGQVSRGKVTTAFRDYTALMLVTDATAFGDFQFHEVGTDNTAEANSQTALIATSGIARVDGTQTNPTASTYQSVATVVADATETWTEHGLFNASTGVTLMDRSLISPTVAVVSLDEVEFTYTLTLNAEA